MQFSDALQRFVEWKSLGVKEGTIRGYDLILRQFCLYIRNKEVESIVLEDILSWFKLMGALQWDRNSFIPKAMALRKFFEFYKHQGFPVIDPWLIPVPEKEYKFPRVADEDGYRKLMATIPIKTNDPRHIRNRSIISMLWDTGARNGELLALNMDDVNLSGKKAVIKTEKSKGSRPVRIIFWGDETNYYLEQWIKKREMLQLKTAPDPFALYISISSGALARTSGQRLSKKGVGEMLRRYSNRAKIPYLNAHSFRHHVGHDLAKKGANNSVISGILGHSSLQSSFIYTLMNDKELEEVYRKFRK